MDKIKILLPFSFVYGGFYCAKFNGLSKIASIIYRSVTIVYLHYTGEKQILEHRKSQHIAYDHDDPLQAMKALGLNLGKNR